MKSYCIEISGPFACFTNPHYPVEQVTYDFPPPSASRSFFESILWKPAIKWHVRKIEIMNPIQTSSIRRNELKFRSSKSYIEENRTQCSTIMLRDVCYRIHADLEFIPVDKRDNDKKWHKSNLRDDFEATAEERHRETSKKYEEMFQRRASRGQHHHLAYLGCREFSANIKFIQELENVEAPINESRKMGLIFYDFDYSNKNRNPSFFVAHMKNGVINIPDWESDEVLR